MRYAARSAGSALRSLGVVGAGTDGVVLADNSITVVGNFLGLRLDGSTPNGNRGDGLTVLATSRNNIIGQTGALQSGAMIARPSNEISGNFGVGIAVVGSSDNTIVSNSLGTDLAGKLGRGNLGDGLPLIGSATSVLGGVVPFGTDPARVAQGNAIAFNGGAGGSSPPRPPGPTAAPRRSRGPWRSRRPGAPSLIIPERRRRFRPGG